MHRLVQNANRNRLAEHRDHWLILTQQLLADQFPTACEDPPSWPTCQRLLPHVLASCDHTADTPSAATPVLLARAGRYLFARGEYRSAATTLERALRLAQAAYGLEHPDTLTAGGNLALAYQSTGRLDEAISLLETTLSARERTLGPEHPHTVTSAAPSPAPTKTRAGWMRRSPCSKPPSPPASGSWDPSTRTRSPPAATSRRVPDGGPAG